jgi:hypothetical protein
METVAVGIERDASGRFVAGQSGNPAGKRPGTRNRKTVLLEALRDGEDNSVARVVIDKALSGHVATARFVLGLISPKPRGRTITIDMPADDDCNVVAAYDATLRLLCAGEITPDEALTVSRFLDGRRRVLQAWQLEDGLIATQRELAEDRAADYADEAADADLEDESDTDVADEEPALAAAAGETALQPEPSLQKPCISPSPGTIRGTIQVPADGFSALDSALASSIARRLAARFETR